jgi:Outer membrane protein beta-barrel domain
MKKKRSYIIGFFKISLIFLILLGTYHAPAQRFRGKENLPTFDNRLYHFGFLLSYNKSSFFIKYNLDFSFQDSLLGISNVPQSGFNLALLASFNPIKNINFRFIPGLSFQDRGLSYRFLRNDGTVETILKRTESVWLEFPLLLKLRTNRSKNFDAYALFGTKYALDMQSQKDVSNATAGTLVLKLADRDLSIDAGGGFDFYMPYFKFCIELKTAFGQRNLLIQDNNKFTTPITSLKSRTFVVSLTFEG